ncbi:hypothetical protein HZ326_7856 [Fusarium oxysporum f. sp. albedinis]|nr:hypothetical protein FOMA001_g16261 [Fusarium oxysporum f. sp. matthiolae]KAJ0149566.1 hypothetical protein HZ326_7856 [Fusarium oxysporum f. sp. albedinis]KAK2472999.1 hypothetical protein H9L39_15174 [Fusarium oxysporum f. sp. albedinis]
MSPSPNQSLHRLSVENSWFATHPILWTSQHLNLLGVPFQHFEGPLHAPQPCGDDVKDLDAIEVVYHVTRLATVSSTVMKLKSALYLLCAPGSPLGRKPQVDSCSLWPASKANLVSLDRYAAKFFYARRPVHETLCHVLHVAKPTPKKQPPVIGYAYYKAINRERQRRFTPRLHPKSDINRPVERLCRLYLRKVTPDNWSDDPYIVCLLLALAQAQSIKQREEKPETFPVRLLLAVGGDKNFAHVFQADVDAHILKALDEPTLDLNGVAWPRITHTKVALQPYLTFPGRIVAELLGSYMEEKTVDGTLTTQAEKRKYEDDAEAPMKRVKTTL